MLRGDMSMLTNAGRVYTKTIIENKWWAIERVFWEGVLRGYVDRVC